MKKSARIIGFIFLFIFSFLFFVWATFPYEVLKETVSNQLSDATGLTVRIGGLGPKFPVGISVRNISVRSETGPALQVKEITASISPLALLLARASASVAVIPERGESLEVGASLGLFSLLKGGIPVPKSIEVNSKGFPVGEYVSYALGTLANSPTANPLVAPLLKQIGFDGKLVADVDIALNADDPADSSGRFSLAFKDAQLTITDPALAIPNQTFTRAKVDGSLAKAMFSVSSGSGFASDHLTLDVDGSISLKQPLDRSPMDISIKVEVAGPLKENFGFLMDTASGTQSDGKLSLKIGGTLGLPSPGVI